MGRATRIAWVLMVAGSLACNKPQLEEVASPPPPASSAPAAEAPVTPSAGATAVEPAPSRPTKPAIVADSPESAKRECQRLVKLRLAGRIAAYRFPPFSQYSHVVDRDGSQEVLILMERPSGTPQFLSVGCVDMRYSAGNWSVRQVKVHE